VDEETLDRLFGDEVREGLIADPLDVTDVWKNAYSENSNWKLWAAKFAARHPNLVALEVGSFRCGHDAPISSVVESIIERSGTPYFAFKDLDENKPAGSIKIRVETIDYFLQRLQSDLVDESERREVVARELARRRAHSRNIAQAASSLIQLDRREAI
jgi:predicted nucleotide-binding protein (sugar kinase/HSP70/actin superfamily)